MGPIRAALIQVLGLFAKRRRDRDLDHELAAHLHLHIDDNLRAGMTAEAARRDALLKLGGLEVAKEYVRDRRGLSWLEDRWRDVRFGIRVLHHCRGFTAVTVLTLALGIGATTAVFSVVDETLLRTAPFPEAQRLVDVLDFNRATASGGSNLSPEKLLGWQAQRTVFERIEGYAPRQLSATVEGEPERLNALVVTTGLMTMLGVSPQLGRIFDADDGRPATERVVMLTDRLWRTHYGSDRSVVGHLIMLDGQRYRIIGVTPRRFQLMYARVDVWLPLSLSEPGEYLSASRFYGMGRLLPGLDLDEAQRRADILSPRLQQAQPLERSWDVRLLTKTAARVDPVARRALVVLLSAVGLVLLIASTNVANLFLSQLTRRSREMAIRSALGATRQRLVWEVFTEYVLIAGLAGCVGLAVAWWGVQALVGLMPANIAAFSVTTIEIDGRVLAFAACLTLVTALVFALVPALRGSWHDVDLRIRGFERVQAGSKLFGFAGILIGLEVALSVVLLVGATLMMRTFANLHAIDPGFEARDVVKLDIYVPSDKYSTEAARSEFFGVLATNVRRLPGVVSASTAVGALPGTAGFTTDVVPDDAPVVPGGNPLVATNTVDGPEYFRTLRIPFLAGRPWSERECVDAAIINTKLAEVLWPGRSAVGQVLRFGADRRLTVIGVVGTVEARLVDTRLPLQLYTCFGEPLARAAQARPRIRSYMPRTLLVRAVGAAALVPAFKAEVWKLDPSQPVQGAVRLEDVYANLFERQRFVLVLMCIFAGLALLLAMAGIFAVVSQDASQRTREMAVRRAVGATSGDIVRLIFAHGLAPVVAGSLAGAAGAVASVRILKSLLFEVSPYDPATFIGTFVVLFAMAATACWWPARRATLVEPMSALRED